MSVLRVNKITNEAGNGPVEFSKGMTFPPGSSVPQFNLNTAGIVTTGDLTVSTNVFVSGVVTARSGGKFVGNGFRITNPPGTRTGKVIGLYLIS